MYEFEVQGQLTIASTMYAFYVIKKWDDLKDWTSDKIRENPHFRRSYKRYLYASFACPSIKFQKQKSFNKPKEKIWNRISYLLLSTLT